jgi:hypothetical protein
MGSNKREKPVVVWLAFEKIDAAFGSVNFVLTFSPQSAKRV